MKTKIIILVTLFLAVGTVTPGFAARYDKYNIVVEGKILSIKSAKGVFVVEDQDDGSRRTVNAAPELIASLQEGEQVRVTLSRPGNFVQKLQR